ncbi:MAG: LysM peptidoglycan-binding domain-containing protein [Planctomycetota bacterium]
MGQLERYGLYVLCLVIFLILGIAIWGDNSGAVVPQGTESQSLAVTSNVGPEDTITEEQLRRLEEEANLNEVLDFIRPRPQPEASPFGDNLPLTKVNNSKNQGERTPLEVPKPASERTHVVKEYETLQEISLRYLGKRRQWRRILALNPHVRPRALKPGMKLKIPPRQQATPSKGALAIPATVTVRRGDSPGLISQRLFGTTRYADAIMRVNNIQDPRMLQIGAVLKVPQVARRKAK